VAGVDVLRAQANELRSESTLVSSQSDEANASETLAQTIGAPAETPFAIPVVVPEPTLASTPLDRLIAIAENSRYDIAGARATLDANRLADGLIETDRRPIVHLADDVRLGTKEHRSAKRHKSTTRSAAASERRTRKSRLLATRGDLEFQPPLHRVRFAPRAA